MACDTDAALLTDGRSGSSSAAQASAVVTRSMTAVATRSRADASLSIVAQFEVRRRGYVSPDGTLRGQPVSIPDVASLISLYRAMVLTRAFDL